MRTRPPNPYRWLPLLVAGALMATLFLLRKLAV